MTSSNYEYIFKACDADQSGSLDISETQYALQAFGLYPEKEYLKTKMNESDLTLPISLTDFQKIVEDFNNNNCTKLLRTVPYARRGLTLGQLKSVQSGLIGTGWLQSVCDSFNIKHEKEIEEGEKFAMKTNLYAMDQAFVQATTNKNEAARVNIPEDVLTLSGIPSKPKEDISFSQLINPDGLEVDYYVSHAWAHPFEKTMKALTHFAEGIYSKIGKGNPDEIVFWIDLFALNQHKAEEEVGETPEQGPLNAALANSKHGAVMVVDRTAEPMRRIWCLFEVSRAEYFHKNFQLIVDEGIVENASIETLKEISSTLVGVRAYKANSSDKMDKLKILYRILDPEYKILLGVTFDVFKSMFDDDDNDDDDYDSDSDYADSDDGCKINEKCFRAFDAHVCSLIGTPLLAAGLKLKSKEVCLQSIGMGAIVTVDQLTEINVATDVKLKTRYGMCGLPIIFARSGQLNELEYVLGLGGDVNEKDDDNRTALYWAAEKGQTEVVSFLLSRGAAIDIYESENGYTALTTAAASGHSDIVEVLLDGGADIEDKDYDGITSLSWAAFYGHLGVVTVLLDRGADIADRDEGGETALHWAAKAGHPNIVSLLLDRGADINAMPHYNRHYNGTPLQAAIEGRESPEQRQVIEILLQRRVFWP